MGRKSTSPSNQTSGYAAAVLNERSGSNTANQTEGVHTPTHTPTQRASLDTQTTQTTPTLHKSGPVSHVPNGLGGHTTLVHRMTLNAETTQRALEGRAPNVNNVQENPHHPAGNIKFRGIERQKGTAIYIEQIAIDGQEENEEIGNMLKEYCASQNIRVMKYRVFRFRSCYDTVACRIIIPESQEHLALNPKSWPNHVSVRRWQNREQWLKEQERRGNNGSYRNDWATGNGHSDHYW